MSSRIVVVLLSASLLTAWRPAAALVTYATPSENQLFQLQKENRGHPLLRITTSDSGAVERKVRVINATGLLEVSTPDGGSMPGMIRWGTVQRIDEVVTRARFWRRTGMVVGGLLGAGLGNALGAPDEEGGRMALAGLLAAGGLGAWGGHEFGSRFRSLREWYVADTLALAAPESVATAAEVDTAAVAPIEAVANPAIVEVCNRIGRDERFRATGSFGSFDGYADIAGPGGLEGLRLHHGGSPAAPPERIAWDGVDRIEMRGGSAARGAFAGGAMFAAFGALIGAAAVAASGTSSANPAEGAALGAVICAPVGITVGGLGGSAVRHWVVVYRRP